MSKWLEFLNLLLSFGPKLPEIMGCIDRILVEIRTISDIIGGGPMKADPGELEEIKIDGKKAPADVLAKERAVMALWEQSEEGLEEGEKYSGVFSNLLAFIKANPEVLQFLLLFLK